MEHEVHVPYPVGSVRAALAEPERGLRCVPGLKLDAPATGDAAARPERGGPAVEESGADVAVAQGRLRVRVAGTTVTYRGTLRITAEANGFAVAAEGTEARGSGTVRLALSVVPRPSYTPEGGRPVPGSDELPSAGTVLAFAGGVSGTGRLAEFDEAQLLAAGRRLLDRFGQALRESLRLDPPDDDNARAIPGIPAPETGAPPAAEVPAGEEPAAEPPAGAHPAGAGAEDAVAEDPASEDAADADRPAADAAPSVFDTEVPPPALDPLADEPPGDDVPASAAEVPAGPPPAEAAHARRTMIGRSAEEVDHAPPRGRYAPVPPPEQSGSGAALRWAAPAAALAVAGAVVFTRALRRRGR